MKLTPNLIYEAALDDQLFAELPSIVARAMDARSCVLHWRDERGTSEISTHSGYFSDANMMNYAANFATHDLWTEAGMGQETVNKGWRTTDLVPLADYERSIFYNEWIRGMGDDTYYCCGSVMRTTQGFGIIGLHRGRTQGDFADDTLRDLNEQVDHLRRMFTIRGRLSHLNERHDRLDEIFASARHAAFMINSEGRIMLANAAADAIVRSERFLRARNGRLIPAIDACRGEFEQALASAAGAGQRRASSCLLRASDGALVIASLMPLFANLSGPTALVTIELQGAGIEPDALSRHLQAAFALSPTEARIAILLADGATIQEISDRRQSAVGTVRTQVKNIMLKLDARRQSGVVRTVSALRHGLPTAGTDERIR